MPARPFRAALTPDLTVRDLVRRMPGGRVVLDGITATFHRGAVTAVIGANGTGKSTLARVLAGVDRPDAGSVARPCRAAFHVPERVPALPGCSAGVVAASLAPAFGDKHDAWRARLDVALDTLGFTHGSRTPLLRLSKGNLQKAYVALAYAVEPAVAVLDEPTTGLDPASRMAAGDLMRALAAEGTALIVTAHEPVAFADVQFRLMGGHLTEPEPGGSRHYLVDLEVDAGARAFWHSGLDNPPYVVVTPLSPEVRTVRLRVEAPALPTVLRTALDRGDLVRRLVPDEPQRL